MKKNKRLSAVFDTETTGLLKPMVSDLSEQPQIIELGLVLIDSKYNIVEEFNWLVNPKRALPEVITKITGITDEDLFSKWTFLQLLPEIEDAFLGVDKLYAHNMPFDIGMLTNELKRVGREFAFPYPPNQVCTVQLASDLVYGRRAKMTELYKDTLGSELKQTHRALDDVKALLEIIKERKW